MSAYLVKAIIWRNFELGRPTTHLCGGDRNLLRDSRIPAGTLDPHSCLPWEVNFAHDYRHQYHYGCSMVACAVCTETVDLDLMPCYVIELVSRMPCALFPTRRPSKARDRRVKPRCLACKSIGKFFIKCIIVLKMSWTVLARLCWSRGAAQFCDSVRTETPGANSRIFVENAVSVLTLTRRAVPFGQPSNQTTNYHQSVSQWVSQIIKQLILQLIHPSIH